MENDTFSETAGLSRRANFRVLSEAVGGPRIFFARRGGRRLGGGAARGVDDEDHERMQALCDEFESFVDSYDTTEACVPALG